MALEGNPRPQECEKIVDDIYRIRMGPWRMIYMINDVERWVDIGKIVRRREDTYRDVEALFR